MLLCVTASHKTAGFDLLERLSVHTSDVGPLIAGHAECVRGAVVVATCNRFEAYLEMDEPVTASATVGVEATLSALQSATGVTPGELEGSYDVVAGADVAEHLFSVASGLESVVVGEGEIAGQVRRALSTARSHGTASAELERLFQRASQAQRGVKNATALGRAGRSLVRLALELADSRVADWNTVPVLLVGTGAYAAASLAALRDHGAHNISVHSPSGRADTFALKHGITAIRPEDYARAAARAGLIVTCTSVEHHVLDAALLRAGGASASAGGGGGCPVAHSSGQLIVDLGMPRNVDPDVTELAGVDVLDLETIRLHAPLEELQATDAARQIVADAAERFTLVGRAQSAAPSVVALRTHVFDLLDEEITRLRVGDDPRTEHALRHFVARLLHTPTVRAHELAAQGRADDVEAAIGALFGLTPHEAELRQDDAATGAA